MITITILIKEKDGHIFLSRRAHALLRKKANQCTSMEKEISERLKKHLDRAFIEVGKAANSAMLFEGDLAGQLSNKYFGKV